MQSILDSGHVWQARDFQLAGTQTQPSGITDVDGHLGGWPGSGLIDVRHMVHGIGEISMFLPGLALAPEASLCAWINPPFSLHAPALLNAGIYPGRCLLIRTHASKDSLWAAEECLKSGAIGQIMYWESALNSAHMRRLHALANQKGARVILFRPPASLPGPCSLRLQLTPDSGDPVYRLRIETLKRQGSWTLPGFVIALRQQDQALTEYPR